jgi:hypothetical protein
MASGGLPLDAGMPKEYVTNVFCCAEADSERRLELSSVDNVDIRSSDISYLYTKNSVSVLCTSSSTTCRSNVERFVRRGGIERHNRLLIDLPVGEKKGEALHPPQGR